MKSPASTGERRLVADIEAPMGWEAYRFCVLGEAEVIVEYGTKGDGFDPNVPVPEGTRYCCVERGPDGGIAVYMARDMKWKENPDGGKCHPDLGRKWYGLEGGDFIDVLGWLSDEGGDDV